MGRSHVRVLSTGEKSIEQWSLRKFLELMDMLITWIEVVLSQVYAYVQIQQIINVKHMQFLFINPQ